MVTQSSYALYHHGTLAPEPPHSIKDDFSIKLLPFKGEFFEIFAHILFMGYEMQDHDFKIVALFNNSLLVYFSPNLYEMLYLIAV